MGINMKRFMRSKRGVSTVISTILMIMVAMIGMSVLFGYVVFYTDNYKAGAGSSVLEHLTVEDVYVKNGVMTITVFNPSTRLNQGTDVDLTVATIYVDGAAVTNMRSGTNHDTINFKEQVIEAGKHATFICSVPPNLGTTAHVLKIVTMRSSTFETAFTVGA
jgi:FlaG/FlaF family flagellin (archaellin)